MPQSHCDPSFTAIGSTNSGNEGQTEAAGRAQIHPAHHNVTTSRVLDTPNQMGYNVEGMVGKRLTYVALTADNGMPSGASS